MGYKVILRLYRPHDMDLLSLQDNDEFLQKAAYIALKAFAAKEYFVLAPPRERTTMPRQRMELITFRLHPSFDREVIDMLNRIAPGGRNNFVKCLLRAYLAFPMDSAFIPEGEQEFFRSRFLLFYKDEPISWAEKWMEYAKQRNHFKKSRKTIKKNKEKKENLLKKTRSENVVQSPVEKSPPEEPVPEVEEDMEHMQRKERDARSSSFSKEPPEETVLIPSPDFDPEESQREEDENSSTAESDMDLEEMLTAAFDAFI